MITIQNYVRAQSLDEAYELNQKKGNKILGGMLWLKTCNATINTAIDLSELGLDTISETDEEFTIGAMATLRSLELHEGLNTFSQNAIADAVKDIVGVQFRNMATVGGSLYGRYGFSDVLTVFLMMDSYVRLHNAGIIPLSEYAKQEYDKDILVELIIKKSTAKFKYNAMRNQRTDFPVITCGTTVSDNNVKAVIGARPDRAIVINDDEKILADGLNKEAIEKFAEYVANNTKTGSNTRGSSEYRKHLIKVLTIRNLLEIGGQK